LKERRELSIQAPGILRLRWSPWGVFEKMPSPVETGFLKPRRSGRRAASEGLELSQTGGRMELRVQGCLAFRTGAKGGFRELGTWLSREFSTAGGPEASAGVVTRRGPARGVQWDLQAAAGTRWYGLGEKTGPLARGGLQWENWNTDAFQYGPVTDPLYKSIPFLLASFPGPQGLVYWGLFLDNPSRSRFDLGRLKPSAFRYQAAFGCLDAWFLAGPGPAEVLERFTRLTGRPLLPPLWSLGFHQSRYSYKSEKEALGIAQGFADRQLPLDAVHLDIDHMRGYRVFTFDPKAFPRPARLVRKLRRLGVHTTLIVDPGVKKEPGFEVFDQGLRSGFFCKDGRGKVFSGKVWPGESVFPDFFEPRAARWWGDQHAGLVKAGVEGIWNDMNEPALFEKGSMEAVVHRTTFGPRSHASLHNLFGQAMSEATARGLARLRSGRRSFLLTRAAYAGIQKSSAVWLGDNSSSWQHLEMGLTMLLGLGLSGVPFCGVDVGGFDKDASPELLARWMQAGALMPFFRNHSVAGSRPQEPWAFGEPTLSICRQALQLRYRLLPYLYGLFDESRRTGAPILRPMLYEFPQEAAAAELGDQFMLGPWLLAAPVTKPGARAREVWLPPGLWTEYWTGQRVPGGAFRLAEAPLERIPLFVREGAILPGWSPCLNTGSADRQVLHLDLYPDRLASSSFHFYEDDGESTLQAQGVFSRRVLALSCGERGGQVCLALGKPAGRYPSPLQSFHLRFHNLSGRPERILLDGRVLSAVGPRAYEFLPGAGPGLFEVRLSVPVSTRELRLEGLPN
jgi:alpha-glucosidase